MGTLTNRYYKTHPFNLFKNDYDYAIYIDGNVTVVSEITCLYNVAHESKIGIAMHKHHQRDCAYDEGELCKVYKKGKPEDIDKQLNRYRSDGFPQKFGLHEATIIVVDLHNTIAKNLLELWWKEVLSTESKRDQLSFTYILWKNGYCSCDVGCLGNDEYHNPKFRIKKHP